MRTKKYIFVLSVKSFSVKMTQSHRTHPRFFSKSLSPGFCVHGCVHIYYSCASKRRNKATLLLEIRGSFILVLCASECVQVCVRPNCLSNRPFVTGGGRVQFSVKIIKEGF